MSEPIARVGYLAGICQYTGSAWVKSNLLWGYNDVVSEAVDDLNLAAGTNSVVGATVPAGEVWIVSTITGVVVSATASILNLFITVGGIDIIIKAVTPPTSGAVYLETGQFVLKAGDKVFIRVFTATAGDDAYLRYAGYKMRLDL